MGITRIYGSDLSPEMVAASKQSLAAFIKEEMIWQERILAVGGTPNKDLSKFESNIIELDAKKIKEAPEKLGISKTSTFQHSNIQIVSE